jgi:membrane fusion protein (multidrug efflux system)
MDGEAGAGYRTLEIAPATAAVSAEATPAFFEKEQSVPAAPEAPKTTAPEAAAAAGRPSPRRFIFMAVAAVVVLVAGYFAYNWWTNGRFFVSTDDAYVSADTAVVTSKVAGYVKSVPVADNAKVKTGDPLVVFDDADFRNAVAQANAQIATGQATIDRLAQQIVAGNAAVTSAQAQLASAKAAADNAKADFDRTQSLQAKSFATASSLDAARAAMEQTAAGVAGAESAITAAQANVAVAIASKTEAERALDQYKLARDQAQLNLDHAVVRAPFDGVVGNNAAEPGEFVQPGQRLLALVPLDDVYIDANFKETQLEAIVPGQSVTVKVDAYPGMPVTGTVVSVSPAAGSVFSLLPPENATGNFTKIVQRIAVRISLPHDVTAKGLIRPGMSVVASIDTRSIPADAATAH